MARPHCVTCTCGSEDPPTATAEQRDWPPLAPPPPSIYPTPSQDRTADSSGVDRGRRWWAVVEFATDVVASLLRIWLLLPDEVRERLLTLLQ